MRSYVLDLGHLWYYYMIFCNHGIFLHYISRLLRNEAQHSTYGVSGSPMMCGSIVRNTQLSDDHNLSLC